MTDKLSEDSLFMFQRMVNDKAVDYQKPPRNDVQAAPSIIRGKVSVPRETMRTASLAAPIPATGNATSNATDGRVASDATDDRVTNATSNAANDRVPSDAANDRVPSDATGDRVTRRATSGTKLNEREAADGIRAKIRTRGSGGLIRGKSGNPHSILDRAMKTQRRESSEKKGAPAVEPVPSIGKLGDKHGVSDDRDGAKLHLEQKPSSILDKNIARHRSRSVTKDETRERSIPRERENRGDKPKSWRSPNYQRGGEEKEKRECLIDLEKLKLQNIKLTKNYSMDDDLVDMQYERDRHNMNMELVQKMKISKGYILLGGLGIVFFNMIIGNKLLLDGWLEALNNELESGNYNVALEQIYHMFHKRGPPSPFWSLGLLCATSVVCTHFSNKMGVSIKGYGKDGDKTKGHSSGTGSTGFGGFGSIMGALSGLFGGGNKASPSIPRAESQPEKTAEPGVGATRRPIRPPSSRG